MPIINIPLVTLDTNVFVSGTTIYSSPPGQIIEAWQNHKIKVALSEPIISEIHDVFTRPYFASRLNWTNQQLNQYVNDLKLSAIVVPGTTTLNVCRDPKDNMVLSCALEAGADYIVSGDKDLIALGRFQGISIKTPRTFVDEIL